MVQAAVSTRYVFDLQVCSSLCLHCASTKPFSATFQRLAYQGTDSIVCDCSLAMCSGAPPTAGG